MTSDVSGVPHTRTRYLSFLAKLKQVSPGVVIDHLLSHREIYPDNKGRHFRKLHEDSKIPYKEMLFFDDCNWGDNCRDVEWACPGVVTVKTPEGLTPEKWAEVRIAFLRRLLRRTDA